MANFTTLPPPDRAELYAALVKMEAADAASITILRKRTQYEPLRNIISGLWFAILYQAVELKISRQKGMFKKSRLRAINNLATCLRAGHEISDSNKDISKTISKRTRSGFASWSTISQEPGLLAIINFSDPPSKEELSHLLLAFEDSGLPSSTNRYRDVVQRILRFIDKTLQKTKSLYQYLKDPLQDVTDLINFETQEVPVSDSSRNDILLEVTFNQSTYPRYTVPYDSPILVCVQLGDIHGAEVLFQAGMASIYDVDPYGLGLLYVRISFSWLSSN
jgi:hypothetical protein